MDWLLWLMMLLIVYIVWQQSKTETLKPNRSLNRVLVVAAVLSTAPMAFVFEEMVIRISVVVLEIVLIGGALVLRKRYL